MAREKAQLQDAFWHGSFGFVAEAGYWAMALPKTSTTKYPDFHLTLSDSGQLPDLKGAPIASWVLARLAFLSGRKFPYAYGEVTGSDGGDLWLRYYVLSDDLALRGMITLSCSHLLVNLWVDHFRQEDGLAMYEEFIQALLENPLALKKCRIVVQYTEMTDPNFNWIMPRIHGWDGHRFLYGEAPEHAIDPDEHL